MSENEGPTEEPEPEGPPMFVCGSQMTNDGDILPGMFTVFPASTDPDQASEALVRRIVADGHSMGLTEGNGQAALWGVWTWEEWAEIKLDPLVKLNALIAAATMSHLLVNVRHADKVAAVNAVAWLPPKS